MYYVYISDDDYKYEIISVSGTMGINKGFNDNDTPHYYLIVTIDYNGEHISLMDRPFDLSGMKFYEDDNEVMFEHISRNLLVK